MYAITLWQPWATAMAAGFKTIETRPWPAPKNLIGQRIAIHAAKRLNWKDEQASFRAIYEELVDWTVLNWF